MVHGNTAATRRTSAINLRAFPAQRELIDRACAATHKNLTDFILEAACREAEHVLCDRRYFVLDEETFNAFEAALDVPLTENKVVKRLLADKAPWED
ncbi:MAG: DUF1778 domain-containing protein [Desulfobacula sp.]|jgi:uncharacterized protein (DUF1778 family)|nr:DUF1778 domain-containing protein [Desulfobacula sp.]